jgi:hypothetical protein
VRRNPPHGKYAPHILRHCFGETIVKCWICGNEAKTGEHLAKVSDLKAIFPNVSQKKPLFFSADSKRNKKTGSIKNSQHLKSKAQICEYCNTTRTQPYDWAWEKLSKYFQGKTPSIKSGDIIKLDKVFPSTTKKSMLDVHYFL